MEYTQAVEYLFGLRKFGKEPGVVREREVLKRLGNPEKTLKIIHVAGTNGKGSVCAYLEEILRQQGYKTGLFTSPHLVRVNERIKINNIDVDDNVFMEAFDTVYKVSQDMQADGLEGIAFFDFVMAMAMIIFKDNNVDYVILETGLGGKLDCSRAVESPVLTVITSVSMDHMDILGNSIEEIAAEKAGIIRKGIPVVFWGENPAVTKIIQQTADELEAPSIRVCGDNISVVKRNTKYIDFLLNNMYYKNGLFSVKAVAMYQTENCAIALNAIAVLDRENTFLQDKIHQAVSMAFWPGRMEEVRTGFYVDGAHNADGIQAFLKAVDLFVADSKWLLFSAVCEKDYDRMIKNICDSGIFDGYIICKLDSYRALELEVIREEFEKYTSRPVWIEQDVKSAVRKAESLKNEGSIVFAAGSLYLVGEIREILF